MKKVILPFVILTSLLASCGQQTSNSSENTNNKYNFTGSYSSYEDLDKLNLTDEQKNLIRYGNPDSSNGFYKIARQHGGKIEAEKYLDSLSDSEREKALSAAGIKYRINDQTKITSQLLQDEPCVKYYPESYHNNYWGVMTPQGKAMRIYIDGYGRPNSSKMSFPAITAGTRDTTCQGNVGNWAEQIGYAGGHMVPDSFGGWGKRFNLYPQEAYFNNTAWKIVEAAAKRCIDKGLPVDYIVDLNFGWFNARVTPLSVVANVNWRNRAKNVFISLGNEPAGGATGDAAATAFRQQLIAEGC